MSALQELKSNFFKTRFWVHMMSAEQDGSTHIKGIFSLTVGGSGGSPSFFVSVIHPPSFQHTSFVLYLPYRNQSKSNKEDRARFYKGYVFRIPKDFM